MDSAMPSVTDLFLLTGEASGDLHGAALAEKLLQLSPSLKIAAVAGPRMRALPIQEIFPMEKLQVMGFTDVIPALPRIARSFCFLRNAILTQQPKGVVCIDYPEFHLRLQRSLRKRGYRGALIHFVCPTVWAWRKKRIDLMAKTLDLLIPLFPFEKNCFQQTPLRVEWVGHPLIDAIPQGPVCERPKLIGLFPGSREQEIERNFPLQLRIAQELAASDAEIRIGISLSHPEREAQIRRLAKRVPLIFEKNDALMRRCRLALATSGTVTLELALCATPTVVQFAMRPLDAFLAQKIFHIDLPFYCIVNLLAEKLVFPELFGPRLTPTALLTHAKELWYNEEARRQCKEGCQQVRKCLGKEGASHRAAEKILSLVI